MIKKLFFYFGLMSVILVVAFFIVPTALAVCPACAIAVGTGVGLSRWLGVDDVISGIWLGGLIVSMTSWSLSWLEKKGIRFPFRAAATSILFYLFIVVPLYFSGIIGHPLNTFCGIDKLLLGTGIGSVVFLISIRIDNFLKKKNNNRSFFRYQKVALPLVSLFSISLIVYILTKC